MRGQPGRDHHAGFVEPPIAALCERFIQCLGQRERRDSHDHRQACIAQHRCAKVQALVQWQPTLGHRLHAARSLGLAS
jgi:hypothetical protein